MSKKGGGSVTQPFQNNSNTSFNNTGTSSGNTSGVNTSTVNTPAGWMDSWAGFQPGANGLNPLQTTGANWMTSALNSADPANLAPARAGINAASGYFQDTLNNRQNPTLRNLAAIDPAAYGAPTDVTAQQVNARRGSEFMSDYQNPFQSQVIDASLNQYDADAANARNALRAANAGAFGNKRFGVAEGQFGADSALGRASLGAGLRSQGFNTAAGLGMQDANRVLSADLANAGSSLNADQFNYSGRQSRNMFDANMGTTYNNQRDQVARDLAGTSGQLGALGTTGFNIGQGLAGGLIDTGGMGANQNLNWLNAAVPTFGQTGTTNNNFTNAEASSGTGTGNQYGYNTGINPAGGKGGTIGSLGALAAGLGGLGWAPLAAGALTSNRNY